MTIEQIQKTLWRKPWRRIEFRLDSGDRVVVDHPEDIFISVDGSKLRLIHDGEEWVTTPEKVTALRRRAVS